MNVYSCGYQGCKHTQTLSQLLPCSLPTQTHICIHANMQNSFRLMLASAAMRHNTQQHWSCWRYATWSIEWACCLDELRFNRKVSIFVEGHGNVNAPQLAKGSQSSRVLHNERWQTQRTFQRKPLSDKHFHFKASILQDVMSIYFYIMSAVVWRQLGESKKCDEIRHCCWLITGRTGTLCVCNGMSVWLLVCCLECVCFLNSCQKRLFLCCINIVPQCPPYHLVRCEVSGWHLLVQRFPL